MGIRSDRRAAQAEMEADWQRQQNERPNIDTRYEPRPRVVRPPKVEPAYHCALCKTLKRGRFTRRKLTSDSGWSQGFAQPIWYCFDCLPYGEGRGETTKGTADAQR